MSCFISTIGDRYEQAKTHYALGWVYSLDGEWEQAQTHHKKGLAIAERYQSLGDDYLKMLGYCYLGNDHRVTKRYSQAEQYYNRALELANKLNEKRERGLILLGLARTYYQHGKYYFSQSQLEKAYEFLRAADQYFGEAETLHYQINYRYRYVMTLAHSAQFCLEAYDYDLYGNEIGTEEHFQVERLNRSLGIACELGSHYYEAEIKVYLCDFYRKKRNYDHIAHLVDEVESLHNRFVYHQLIARIKAIAARAEIEQQAYEKATELYAQSFQHAISFNSYLVQEIGDEFEKAMKTLRGENKLAANMVREFCMSVVDKFNKQLNQSVLGPRRSEQAEKLKNALYSKINNPLQPLSLEKLAA